MTGKPWLVTFVGGKPAWQDSVRKAILGALRASGFRPARTTTHDEVGAVPFNESEVTEPRDGPSQTLLFLEGAGFELEVALGTSPTLRLRTEDGVAAFACGDALASACEPDLGWVVPLPRPSPPLSDDEARLRSHLVTGAGRGGDFHDRGPGALGVRTWIGPRALRHVPREALLGLPPPVVAAETPWGGIRIDLVADPVSSDDAAVLSSFRAAMRTLEPTGFFASAVRTESGTRFEPPSWWSRNALGGEPASKPSASRPSGDSARLRAAAAGGATLKDAAMRGFQGKGAVLTKLRAERVDLTGADLSEAKLDHAVLVDVDLDEAALDGATFESAQLDQVGLRKATGARVCFAGADLIHSFLQDATLTGADFGGAKLSGTALDGASLPGADFEGALVEDSTFTRASLTNARFLRTELRRCDFGGADLTGADFSKAKLDRCNFEGAKTEGAKFDRGAEPKS